MLTDEYHVLNRAIHRAETDIEPHDDFHVTEMRRRRMQLRNLRDAGKKPVSGQQFAKLTTVTIHA